MHHIVIIGGGFGGLYAAKALRRAPVRVTLIDKRNFHLFQPLLYQVATGGVSPGDIASPLRAVLHRQKNTRVIAAEAVDVLPDEKKVILSDGEIGYDTLIVATGVQTFYFGNDEWEREAPGLKTVEDALEIRRRIFLAFEAAERESNPEKQKDWITFVVIGGGPTGVELAGAIGELAKNTLKEDFRYVLPSEAKILLLEGKERILPSYPPDLSAKAVKSLEKLGVTVQTDTFVTKIGDDVAVLSHQGQEEAVHSKTIIWAAGVTASPMGRILEKRAGAELDRMGRVIVQPDLSLASCPDILVVGDLAHYVQDGSPLPGVAQVAMQQGRYAAELVQARLKQKELPAFRYKDKGNLAVIGRNAAVADIRGLHLSGALAWFIWIFIHILFLIEFGNKVLVMFQWAWTYWTKKRGARLITGPDPFPLVQDEQ